MSPTSPTRAEWLLHRRGGIGASDVAAIVGISQWASPYTVWLDKTGQREDIDNEAMEAGRMLEPAIGPWFTARTGLYVAGEQTWCAHRESDWARATVDGFVFEHDAGPDTELDAALGGLEIKTTSESAAKWADDGIPAYYQAQAQWQMHVTGMERTWFAVLHANFGLRLRVYELDRDADDIALLVERCTAFWNDHVLAGVPPEVDGHPATTEALRGINADPDAEAVDLDSDPAASSALLALPRVKAQIKALEAERDGYENLIRAALGESTTGLTAYAKSVTWKPQETSRLDTTALRKRLPKVAARFTNTTTTRVLRVTAKKEEAA